MATLRLNIARIRQFMAAHDWNEREMAYRMEIALAYLSRMLSGQRQVGNRALGGLRLVGLAWDEMVTVVPDTISHDFDIP